MNNGFSAQSEKPLAAGGDVESSLGLYSQSISFHLTSLLGFKPSKNRFLTIKTRVKQVLGMYTTRLDCLISMTPLPLGAQVWLSQRGGAANCSRQRPRVVEALNRRW